MYHWTEQIKVAMRYATKMRRVEEEEIFKFNEGLSALLLGWQEFYNDLCSLPEGSKFRVELVRIIEPEKEDVA